MNHTIKFFLIINESGSVRTTKTRPYLKVNEISVGVDLVFPREIFKKPQLNATLTISDDAVSRPEITSEVMDGVRQAIEQNIGMEVKLSIAEADEA